MTHVSQRRAYFQIELLIIHFEWPLQHAEISRRGLASRRVAKRETLGSAHMNIAGGRQRLTKFFQLFPEMPARLRRFTAKEGFETGRSPIQIAFQVRVQLMAQ